MLDEIIDRDSTLLVLLQHRLYQVPELVGVTRRNPLVLTLLDLDGECELVQCLEGWPKSRHFISQAPQRPNITFLVIALVIDLLGTHVVGRADVRLSEDRSIIENASQAKITQLGVLI